MELKTFFAQDKFGNLVPGATVTVYLSGTTTLATGLKDQAGAALSNPFNADSTGKAAYQAPNGTYDMVIGTADGTTSRIALQFFDYNTVIDAQNQTAANLAAQQALLTQTQDIINNAGDQSTLVRLNQPDAVTIVGAGPQGYGTPPSTTPHLSDVIKRVTPFQFGAKANGTDDDAPAIQAAHDWCMAQSARDPSDTTRRTGGYILDLNGPRYWTIKSSMTWNMGDIIIEGGMSTLDCRQFPVGTDINNQTVVINATYGGAYHQTRSWWRDINMLGPGQSSFCTAIRSNRTAAAPGGYERLSNVFYNGSIEAFGRGLSVGSNSYFQTYYNFSFGHCNEAYYFEPGGKNYGEQITFYSCVFNAGNYQVTTYGGMSNFYGCSFDYCYHQQMVLNGGMINCVNCWWEGYGPVDYIINIPESTTSVRLNIIGGLFSFKAGATGAESRATSNPFYFGTRAAVKFENVQFQKLGNAYYGDSTTAWIDGASQGVSFSGCYFPNSANSFTTVVMNSDPTVINNQFATDSYTLGIGAENWLGDAWILANSDNGLVRKSRWGYGLSNGGTTFSFTRTNNGFVNLDVTQPANSGTFEAVVGMIPVRSTGQVVHYVSGSLYLGTGDGSVNIKTYWVKLIVKGTPSNPDEPQILEMVKATDVNYPIGGTSGQLHNFRWPPSMPTGTQSPASTIMAPDWATHCILTLDISKIKRNMGGIRINEVFMRQI
ncbi:tailspike protein [Serratia phage MTx]|uniref:Tailspike protein n=1 Tax=Serratia phage MTx TaxID=2557553 RepID=A0A482MI55_9CAUD|nr:tailspike protein [Serratia phage MTx]QBQ72344.1 tailspike protein [Serratia phage MTx]